MHYFQCVTNCKNFVTYVRRECIKTGSVAIQHNFNEAMIIQHNKEIQSKRFGGGATVSIEGYTAHYPDPVSSSMDEEESNTIFDFHSFLSNDKTQIACTVDAHVNELIEELMHKNSSW